MQGEGRKRFCPNCQTYVHAIEQYSLKEIECLGESAGRLCGYIAGESLAQPRSRRAMLVAALLTAISPLMAQSGRARIRVTDASGVVIQGAEAYMTGKDQEPILIRANEAGEILLANLPIGDSRITVTHPGFKNLPVIVTIRNADELRVDAKLEAHVDQLSGNFHKKRRGWWIFH